MTLMRRQLLLVVNSKKIRERNICTEFEAISNAKASVIDWLITQKDAEVHKAIVHLARNYWCD